MQQGWQGHFDIEINRQGTIERFSFPNLITDDWLNALKGLTLGNIPALESMQIGYIALGDDAGGTLPFSETNSQLGNERFRKPFTKAEDTGTGKVKRTVNINSSEANFHIQEIGIFAGAGASSTDSGIMVARVPYDRDKDELESINIVRTDTIGRL